MYRRANSCLDIANGLLVHRESASFFSAQENHETPTRLCSPPQTSKQKPPARRERLSVRFCYLLELYILMPSSI